MIRTAMMIVAVSLLGAAEPEDEIDRLQGRWKLVREHIAGSDLHNTERTWVIKGDSLTITHTITGRGTIRLDPTRNPGRFEKTNASSPGRKLVGIYVLEGDTFKTYSSPLSRDELPTDFPKEPDRRYLLDVWKRQNAPKGEGLDGDWKLVERLQGQRRYDTKDFTMKIEGGEYSIRNHQVIHATIKLDPTTKLKQIDIKYGDDSPVLGGKTRPKVYRLEGDRLTVWAGTLDERPTEVSDELESSNYFEVFERVKP